MIKYKKGVLSKCEKVKLTKQGLYSDEIFTFDIEVSSFWIDENGAILDLAKANELFEKSEYDKKVNFFATLTPMSCVYIWQFGYADKIYYGRDLREFKIFLSELVKKVKGKPIIFVHNLSYEFHFLNNILTFDKDGVFARSAHKVMKATPTDYEIEFRCSYFLTRLSLEKWGENVGVSKMVGDLDYNKLRSPLTRMAKKELGYSEHDILVMYYGLKKYADKYGSVYDIPLTQTGEVRRPCKKLFQKDYKYHQKCTDMLPNTSDDYLEMLHRFRGGDTHANFCYIGQVVKNVKSKDFNSSYPARMACEQFPMGKWRKSKFDRNPKYCYRLKVEYIGLKPITLNHYISKHKCNYIDNGVYDNGKVIEADKLEIDITEQDFYIIEKAYKSKKVNILSCEKSLAGYLPIELVMFVLELYKSKTELKNVENQEENYICDKQRLNSIFGMTITAIIQDSFLWNGNGWKHEAVKGNELEKALEELHEKKYKNWLIFDWGIWITAYSRSALWNGIFEMDSDTIYYDTDSLKHIGEHEEYFKNYNEKWIEKIKKVSKDRNIPLDYFMPKDINGNKHILGIWEDDGEYLEFRTWGAKRYCYRDKKDNKLHLTVSGVNKKKGVNALHNDINNFKDGLVFNENDCGKLLMSYLYDMPSVTLPDGYKTWERYGINARPNTYKMGLSSDFEMLLRIIANKPQLEILNTKFSQLNTDKKERKKVSNGKQKT